MVLVIHRPVQQLAVPESIKQVEDYILNNKTRLTVCFMVRALACGSGANAGMAFLNFNDWSVRDEKHPAFAVMNRAFGVFSQPRCPSLSYSASAYWN